MGGCLDNLMKIFNINYFKHNNHGFKDITANTSRKFLVF